MKASDWMVLIALPLIFFCLVFFGRFSITYLESLIVFFALPSLYLSFKDFKKTKKVLIFSLLVSIPVALIFELVAVGDNAWSIPQSFWSYRLFDFSPLENYLWQFLTVYLILIFYEVFYDKTFKSHMSKRVRTMNLILYLAALLCCLLFIFNPSLLKIPYSFLWLGVVFFLIPVSMFLFKYPKFFLSFLKVQLYFLYIHTVFELIGVKLQHWIYGGTHYIGEVAILRQSIPVEELFFVMIFGAFAACTYYEFFANRNLNKT